MYNRAFRIFRRAEQVWPRQHPARVALLWQSFADEPSSTSTSCKYNMNINDAKGLSIQSQE